MVELRDRHKGAVIWVCGSGPSLLDVKLPLPKNHVSIACNSAVLHFGKADYMLLVDGLVRNSDYYKSMHPEQVVINLNELIKPVNRYFINIFGKSSDWGDWSINKSTHFPGNSTQRAVSFAHAMGASKIILAGCDLGGGHPYCAEDEDPKETYAEDRWFWQVMVKTNPWLDLWTISKTQGMPMRYTTYEEASTW
jgi:hypothetical protein